MMIHKGFRLLLIIVLLAYLKTTSFAEDWKGIIPGRATRSDVVRLLQKCADRTVPCEFVLDSAQVRIVFSGMVQDYFYQCTKRLPADTVLVVEVTPHTPIPLKNLRHGRRLRRLGSMSQFRGYVDERSGLILKVFRDKIIQLNYVASGAERGRCEDYYDDPIQFVRVETHCPPITLEGPTQPVTDGVTVDFQANVQPDPKMALFWTVTGGKIVGRTGRQISLDTTGLGRKTLKISVQARGSCSVENSLTLSVQP